MTPQSRVNRFVIFAVAIALIFILYGIGFLLIFDRPVEYERPRPLTGVEKFRLYEATYKIGRHVVITGNAEIVVRMESGGKRVLRREA